jgi:hypothetical protein
MHPRSHRPRPATLVLAALAALILGAGSGDDGAAGGSMPTPAPTTLGARPRSSATLTILAPRNGQTISRQAPEVRLGLRGARVVPHATTRVRPDQGHLHLLVDGRLVAMDYGLHERLPTLAPGQHLVQVEFVAADHAPFEPRVLAQAAFQVRP